MKVMRIKQWLAAALAAALVLLTGCSGKGGETMLTIGEHAVSYDEYRYFFMNYKDEFDYAGYESEQAEEQEAEIRENALIALRYKYAKLDLAEEHSVAITSEDRETVTALYRQTIEEFGGKEGFDAALLENYMTDDFFVSVLEFQQLEDKLRAFLTDEYTGNILSDDQTVEADIYRNFYHATHILILNEAGDAIEKNYARAMEAYERAMAGEDFNALIAAYNEDTYMAGDPTGYYFTHGQMIQVFEDAVKALEIGEISEVVLTENGYHVIKRLPLEADYIDEHFEELRDAFKARKFNEQVEARANALSVEYAELYAALDLHEIVEDSHKQ